MQWKRSLKDIKCLIEHWKSFLLRKFSTNWESNDQSKCTFNCPESNFAFCQFSLSHGSIVLFVVPNEKTKSIHFYFHVYYQLCNPQGLCIFLRFVVVEQYHTSMNWRKIGFSHFNVSFWLTQARKWVFSRQSFDLSWYTSKYVTCTPRLLHTKSILCYF